MSGAYLSRAELAELVGCKESSTACMRRWLERNKWPHAKNRAGFPLVLRAYFNQRMLGELKPKENMAATEPNRAALIRKAS